MTSDDIQILGEDTDAFGSLEVREIWERRELLYSFVRRDFLYKYRQNLFGPLWFLLQPLLMTLTFCVVFHKVAKVSTDEVPPVLFYLSGLVVWNYFYQSFESVGDCLRSHAPLLSKVYFPRLMLPLSVVISRLFTVLLQLGLVATFYGALYFLGETKGIAPTVWLLALPFLMLQIALLSLGAGLYSAAMTVRHRDFQNLIGFVIPLIMYGTPVIYPATSLPASCWWWLYVNPLSPVVEAFRHGLFGRGLVGWHALGCSLGLTLAFLLAGIRAFRRVESNFIDSL